MYSEPIDPVFVIPFEIYLVEESELWIIQIFPLGKSGDSVFWSAMTQIALQDVYRCDILTFREYPGTCLEDNPNIGILNRMYSNRS